MTTATAQRLAAFLWRVYGVTHDPRVYRCRLCGADCRREHDHMTQGHVARLCSGCYGRRVLGWQIGDLLQRGGVRRFVEWKLSERSKGR